ncbi:MAG: hypothetical protein COA42_22230 [Alteromonadaceae bacterium]|nr:MAG: hypothetical protein COA42_22230 [Alteromonadaceae bacterium]
MSEISLILKSLLRSKVVPLLIILQLALSIAIVSNVTFFIFERVTQISRPTGLDHQNIGKIVYKHDNDEILHRQLINRDLTFLNSRPGITSASIASGVPLSNGGMDSRYKSSPDSDLEFQTQQLYSDDKIVETLGLTLLEGRNFNSTDVGIYRPEDLPTDTTALISKSLADIIFPGGSAVGKQIYSGDTTVTVVGVVSDSIGFYVTWEHVHNMVYLASIPTWAAQYYLIKTDTTNVDQVLSESIEALKDLEFERSVSNPKSMSSLLRRSYNSQYSMIYILSLVTLMLVFVNVLGIVGLTTFWVNQRRKQIGIRRALGASKAAITQYFLIENTLLVLAAAILGGFIAYSVSGYLMRTFSMQMLPLSYVPIASIVILFVTLAAALHPALKAAEVSPVEAVAD